MPPANGIMIQVVGANEIAQKWRHSAASIDDECHAMTKMMTKMLVVSVKEKASRPPGPRIQSGNYVKSIKGEVKKDAMTSVGTVYSDAPQARRLELGYIGTDSLGRTYHQQPYPHWRIAHEEIEHIYIQAISGIVMRV